MGIGKLLAGVYLCLGCFPYIGRGDIVQNMPGKYCYAVNTCDDMGDIIDYVIKNDVIDEFADVMYNADVKHAWIKRRDWSALEWSCDAGGAPQGSLCPYITLEIRQGEEEEEEEEVEEGWRLPGWLIPGERSREVRGPPQYRLTQDWTDCNKDLPVLCQVSTVQDDTRMGSDPGDSDNRLSKAAIVGIVLGVLATLAVLFLATILLIFILRLRKKDMGSNSGGDSHDNPAYSGHTSLPQTRKVSFSTLPESQGQPEVRQFRRQSTKSSGLYAVIDESALDDVADISDVQDDYDDVMEVEHSDVTDSGYGDPDQTGAPPVHTCNQETGNSDKEEDPYLTAATPGSDVTNNDPGDDDVTVIDNDVYRSPSEVTPRTMAYFFSDSDEEWPSAAEIRELTRQDSVDIPDGDVTDTISGTDYDVTLVDNVTYESPPPITDHDITNFFSESYDVLDGENAESSSSVTSSSSSCSSPEVEKVIKNEDDVNLKVKGQNISNRTDVKNDGMMTSEMLESVELGNISESET